MLGVSFSELGLIFVVALIVLGPARLPGLVRKIGRWVGKARSMARDFQQQLENEINLDELNRMTDIRSQKPEETTPAPSPDAAEDPPAEAPAAQTASKLSDSGYPYGTPEPSSADAKPGDDDYSHAHAPGESPVADEPAADEAEQGTEPRHDQGTA